MSKIAIFWFLITVKLVVPGHCLDLWPFGDTIPFIGKKAKVEDGIKKTEFNGFKASVVDSLEEMAVTVGKLAEVNATANVEAKIAEEVETRIAAYDRSKNEENTVGGDQTKTIINTNDPRIFLGILGLAGSIMTGMGGIIILMLKQSSKKDQRINQLVSDISAKENDKKSWKAKYYTEQNIRQMLGGMIAATSGGKMTDLFGRNDNGEEG